jgi:hypothetical protein
VQQLSTSIQANSVTKRMQLQNLRMPALSWCRALWMISCVDSPSFTHLLLA